MKWIDDYKNETAAGAVDCLKIVLRGLAEFDGSIEELQRACAEVAAAKP